jgi:putative inorganic carbon (hco3(-)) transporter
MDPKGRTHWDFLHSIAKFSMVIGLGCLLGAGVFFLAGKELRWMLLPALALFAAIFFMVVPAKQRVLTTVFVLSFQVDIYLRFLYGRANSTEGLALPLVVVMGLILAGWYYFSGNTQGFTWGGTMRKPIAALLIIMVASIAASSERFIGMSALLYTLEYYFLYWLAFNIVRTQQDFKRLIVLIMLTLAMQSIVYFAQSALGITFDFLGNTITEEEVPRPGGTVSSNPAGFVSFIVPALMMASAVALSKYRRLMGVYAIPLMFLGLAAVGLSFTRAAWLGLIFGFIAIIWTNLRRRSLNPRMIVALVIVAVIGLSVLFPKMLERVSSDYGPGGAGATAEAYDERMGLNLIALNVIAHHPLLGVGPGAYSHEFRAYVPAGMHQWLFTVHNQYLLWAAETGIPGGIAFIVLIVTGFKIALRVSRAPPSLISICATGWFGAMIVLAWMMFWVPWIGFTYNAMFWFMLGLMDAAQRLVPTGRNDNLKTTRMGTILPSRT